MSEYKLPGPGATRRPPKIGARPLKSRLHSTRQRRASGHRSDSRDHVGRKGKAPADGQSRGSGFIIDPEGYVLTAQHVIDKAQEVELRLADGERLPARVIAAMPIDLAILKISADRALPICSSATRSNRVGNLAIVFGYPFGRESSMNLGDCRPPRPEFFRFREL